MSGAEVEVEPPRRDQHGAAGRPAAAHRRIRRQPVGASTLRFAAYVQDEWNLTPNWAAHAGLRWEGDHHPRQRRGGRARGAATAATSGRRSLHAVWKPDPEGPRPGALQPDAQLPLAAARQPDRAAGRSTPAIRCPGRTRRPSPTAPATPTCKPELATGIDIAVERYLPGSGMLSANVFRRNISDYMRGVTTLETVSYADLAALRVAPAERRRCRDPGPRARGEVPRQRPVGGGAADRRARQRQLLPLAREGGARPRQPARPAARLHRQPRPRLPLPRPAARPRRQRQLDAGLHDPRSRTRRPRRIGRKLVADVYGLWTFSPTRRAARHREQPRGRATTSSAARSTAPTCRTSPSARPRRPPRRPIVNLQFRLELKI